MMSALWSARFTEGVLQTETNAEWKRGMLCILLTKEFR